MPGVHVPRLRWAHFEVLAPPSHLNVPRPPIRLPFPTARGDPSHERTDEHRRSRGELATR
jgi:hypothetical protein